MKKKIISYLALLFIFFAIGAVASMINITRTVSELKKIIMLHNVEILRQNLVIKIQKVSQDLLTVHTELSRRLDKIVSNVTDLDNAIDSCAGCHHSPPISAKISSIKVNIGKFEEQLSYYITAAADEKRIRDMKSESYETGNELLKMTQEMTLIANQKLQSLTHKAIDDVRIAQQILILTLFLAFLVGLWIAVNLTRRIISPVRDLIDVSRQIASGNLGYTTKYKDSTEFGELANSFNEMSLSLKESNERIILNLNRLGGLYRITLPLHTVTSLHEVFKEVSYGVAEIVDVEQCGMMLLDRDSDYFEHKFPAIGLDETQAGSLRVPKKEIMSLYFEHNRRPVIMNRPDEEKLPEGLLGEGQAKVFNLMLGWVRQKGELIGVIRLANKRGADFMEESSRLIGIISNNVSVAIENIKLYEDLKAQMEELRSTQEQLIQAAKLAAIGELASNVAHEINNPLTSIMGYAELIKEETDITVIRDDIRVIEKESIRARDIVQELLEFSRKRPLELIVIDLNDLINESVALARGPLKVANIIITEQYGNLPSIQGDPNQLKQVVLNIINNSIDAVSNSGGRINIKTDSMNSNVIVEISDNGMGIASKNRERIFEPFFTTKRDKGTGLGLPITRKIIESHSGTIDVMSDVGKGTKFTITLPVKT
jgi:signal transduction histidine kinase/methyl-accepting chemotaxis protein